MTDVAWVCEECRAPWVPTGPGQCQRCGNRTRIPEDTRSAHDKLYDPENRQAQRGFVRGVPKTDRDAGKLVQMWRCGVIEHGECWSSSHLSTREVGLDARSHAEHCTCWRHTILNWAQKQRVTQRTKVRQD